MREGRGTEKEEGADGVRECLEAQREERGLQGQAGCSGEPMENEEREGLQLLDGFRVSFRVLWCGWWWAGR